MPQESCCLILQLFAEITDLASFSDREAEMSKTSRTAMPFKHSPTILACASAFALLLVAASGGAFASAGDAPAELNRAGISLAESGQLSQAVKKFRDALKLRPGSAEYLNNIGVAMMRMGRLDEASSNFNEALRHEPNHLDAAANKEYLETHLMNKDDSPAPTLKPRKRLPRVHVDQLNDPGFEEFARGQRPFLLTGATEKWSLFSKHKRWDVDYFRKHFGNYTADFYPHNMRRVNVHPYLVKMADALDEFENPSGAYPVDTSSPGTYIQWNVPTDAWERLREEIDPLPLAFRLDEQWIDECMRDDIALQNEFSLKLHWRMVLIGTENAGMFFHMDVLNGSSWQAQIQGAKRWTLCDPAKNKGKLYSAGEVDTFAPDLRKFPAFADSECYDDIVRAGEMVFYPQDYWHQTRNLATPTVTISGTVVDGNNHEAVERELRAQCDANKWNWGFSNHLCSELPKCYKWWRQHTSRVHPYGMSDVGESEFHEL